MAHLFERALALIRNAKPDNGLPSISDPWPVKDIVYVSIVAPLMLMACLEWILFFLAFNYCLVKVFIKAEHWSIRVLALVQCILFSIIRLIFLPVMFVTLPLPSQVVQYYPKLMVDILQSFAFYTFAGLLCIPWLFCIYHLITNNVGRHKRVKYILDEVSAPKTVIVMPCYKEEPEVLLTAINSVVDCDYPASCIHVFLSFDGDQEDELYLKTIESLGVPITLETYPKSIDVTYKDARITISRFPHGGKRHCQKQTYKLIDKIYADYLKRHDNLFVLFIDSDCILDPVCIQNFMYDMELRPGSRQNMLAMTGVITSTTKKNSLITVLQDMEYIHGQLFERSVESSCGSVTCLPGALTMLRFSAFRKMAKYYFADKAEQCDDLFDFGKCHLGEDRWLTHLFMIGAKERYQIQVCTGAFCKTEAVQTYKSLLKQRRRWFLGYITNEACMLTDARLWRRYPLLCIYRFAQNTIRTTALLFFILVLSLVTTEQSIKTLPIGFIGVSLGLNWALMFYFGGRLKRFKIWLYPIMFVVNPFFNWVYMVYGIFTAGQRTWGGPRADAGSADTTKTPAQVVEEAEKNEDELNIVPETFRAAAEAAHHGQKLGPVSVLPDQSLEGQFVQATRLPGGWYDNSSHGTLPFSQAIRDHANAAFGLEDENGPLDRPRVPLHPRSSFDSTVSSSEMASIYLPRRVESFMDEDERSKFASAQQAMSQQTRYRDQYNAHNSPYMGPGPAFYQPSRGNSMTDDGFAPAQTKSYLRDRVIEYSDDEGDLGRSSPEDEGGYDAPTHTVPTHVPRGSRSRPPGHGHRRQMSPLGQDSLRLPGPVIRSDRLHRSPLARGSVTLEDIELQEREGMTGVSSRSGSSSEESRHGRFRR